MFKLFQKKSEDFICPASGSLIPIEQVNDPVFSQKMMGDGFAIVPSGENVYAPLSGIISVCFPTKHAIGMKAENGVECLIHIGINTVELKGKGFTSLVSQGQMIKQGNPLVEFDLEEIKKLGYDPTIIVVFPERTLAMQVETKPIEHHQILPITFS